MGPYSYYYIRPIFAVDSDNDDLFGTSNRVDDYDDDFGTQDGGLFSTKGGLFDDDAEEVRATLMTRHTLKLHVYD